MTRARRLLCFGGVPLGAIVCVIVAIGHGTWAAYVSTTSNSGSSYAAGSVAVSDDDGGATYSFPSLTAGQTKTWCTTVSDDGTLTSDIRLDATAGGSIPNSIALSVDIGTGGDPACSGFSQTANLYSGTLGGLAATTAGAWATGLTGFAGATSGSTRTYRFRASLNDGSPPAGATASATFTWEARSQ